jgi:predicted phage terminase large subunit-like protein
MATRWHVDDLSGYLLAKENFRYINLKAIAEPQDQDDVGSDGRIFSDPLQRRAGESLWYKKPPEFFGEERSDSYWWSSMYQGEPRPLGASIFRAPGSIDDAGNQRGPGYYRTLPESNYRGAFGIDLAYSAKTAADFSICIEGIAHEGKLYIVDVIRKQVDAPSFGLTLKSVSSKRPGWPIRWYIGGTEKSSVDFFARLGIRIKAITATADKLIRATPVAAAWNNGDVLLPDRAHIDAPWMDDFLEIVLGFTGQNDTHDDDVDALAALFDQLMKKNALFEAFSRNK